jgi:hypothetical protein
MLGCPTSMPIGSRNLRVQICGIPHLAKNERDAPTFLHAALDKGACAPFFKERRMRFAEPPSFTGNRGCGAPSDRLLRESFRLVWVGLNKVGDYAT